MDHWYKDDLWVTCLGFVTTALVYPIIRFWPWRNH